MAGKIKKKVGEKLDFSDVSKMLALYEGPDPIKWTEACDVLNIAHNKPRLTKIIELHKEQIAKDTERRAANKGKPAADHEIKHVIEQYLEGVPVSEISDQLYRSTAFVRNIIENVGVPTRGVGDSYASFSPLPDKCVADEFLPGEIAWSARYSSPCIVEKHRGLTSDGVSNLYQIYVLEPYEEPDVKFFASVGKAGFYANQAAYDLGKLDHLKQYGIDISRKFEKSS